MRTEHTLPRGPAAASPSLVRWGAVFAGVIVGLSSLLLLSSLWVAIAYGANVTAIANSLAWFIAGSAVVAMLLGGFLAGWLSGIPSAKTGLFNGLAVWGLILIGSIVLGAPGALGALSIDPSMSVSPDAIGSATLWAPFLTLIVGALAAGLGGMLGGKTTRPAAYYAMSAMRDGEHRSDHDHRREDTHRSDGTIHLDDHGNSSGDDSNRERSDYRELAYTKPRTPDDS